MGDRCEGQVKFYLDDRRFGFLLIEGGPDVHFHAAALAPGYAPKPGDAVSFRHTTYRDGRPGATEIQLIDGPAAGGADPAPARAKEATPVAPPQGAAAREALREMGEERSPARPEMPDLTRWAFLPANRHDPSRSVLPDLATLALKEDWSYQEKPSDPVDEHGVT